MPIECRQAEKRPCRHHRQIGFAGAFPYMGCALVRLAQTTRGLCAAALETDHA